KNLAQRAAELDAARNAAAVAAGLKIGPKGIADAVPNGRVKIDAVIKGQKVQDVRWLPKGNPTECRLKLRVPLWGVDSVASVCIPQIKQGIAQAGHGRITLVESHVDVSDDILIIDARGTRLSTCLFPVIADEQDRVLYDVSTVDEEAAKSGSC